MDERYSPGFGVRAVFVLIFAAFLFACEEEAPNERETSREDGDSRSAERTESFGGPTPGDIRIGSARWAGEEILVRGEIEGGGYVIFCDLREGEDGEGRSVRHDAEASGVEVVGDTFVYTFVGDEGGFDPSLEYRAFCALAGGGGGDANSFADPRDEARVTGDP